MALVVAFLVTAALWWLYFSEVAEHSRRRLVESDDPGRLARDAYTYLHLPIVAGVIVTAVGDELLLLHPHHSFSGAGAAVMIGGPVIFLAGETLFRIRMIQSANAKRLTAIGVLLVLGALASHLSALGLTSLLALVLIGIALWEHPPSRSAPST